MQLNSSHNVIDRTDYWERHFRDQPIKLGVLSLSPSSNRVKAGNVQIFLRPKEFRLLHFFMTHPDEVHTREHLLEEIWGGWIVVGERTVDVHIRRLRATLQPFGLDSLVQTVHCRGYLFLTASNEALPAAFIN
ncbi:MAG: winged helix-turn-helix domain-containing protein [Gallionellaceae bacterium]